MGAPRAGPLLMMVLKLSAIARAVPMDRRSAPPEREALARDAEQYLERGFTSSKMDQVSKDERCMIYAGRNCNSKQQMWTITDDEGTTTTHRCAEFYCATRRAPRTLITRSTALHPPRVARADCRKGQPLMCRNGKREHDEKGRKMCQDTSDGIRIGTKTRYIEKFRKTRKCKKGNTDKENLSTALAFCKQRQAEIRQFLKEQLEDAKPLNNAEVDLTDVSLRKNPGSREDQYRSAAVVENQRRREQSRKYHYKNRAEDYKRRAEKSGFKVEWRKGKPPYLTQ